MGATAGATSESTVERLGGRAAGWASCRSGSVRHGAIERTCTGAGDAGRRAMPPPPRAPSRAVARRRSDDVACGRILPRLGARVGRSAEHRDRGVSRSDAAPRFPRGPCNAARAVRLKAVRAPVSNGSKPPQAGAARSARGARPGCPARANRVFAAPVSPALGPASLAPRRRVGAGVRTSRRRSPARSIRSAAASARRFPQSSTTNFGRFAHLSPRSLILQFLRNSYIQWSADAS
ncbi:Uncharacterised protein [Burkholderia pseudomallei]|nr:Uncharacterised protein [Burkholderia pseudomallei]VCD25598.1 Uncharacterised protein [Burkholderia pseudomallei]VCN13452.1 Uncharacterised protein [Burkholderia pseudomallei]VCN15799.1 Uncharacterised protein [Burkholderia pseudomallei]VCP43793.1 Uncharacterised protein [Burkholderia pseudomallei]